MAPCGWPLPAAPCFDGAICYLVIGSFVTRSCCLAVLLIKWREDKLLSNDMSRHIVWDSHSGYPALVFILLPECFVCMLYFKHFFVMHRAVYALDNHISIMHRAVHVFLHVQVPCDYMMTHPLLLIFHLLFFLQISSRVLSTCLA